MQEKERIREMDEIIESGKAEEIKRKELLNKAENSILEEDKKYDDKINKIENELLEEQNRTGVFDKSSTK